MILPLRHIPHLLHWTGAVCLALLLVGHARASTAEGLIVAGDISGDPEFVNFVNYAVNAGVFYDAGYFGGNTVIANVEAGHVWGEHEVFDRSAFDLPAIPSVQLNATPDPETSPQLGEYDFHATMVAHVLTGTGDAGDGNLTLHGVGMAPFAGLWSGAIATSFSTEDIGSFSFSNESFLVPYVGFFSGAENGQPDVINSSWGFSGDGSSFYTQTIDALASDNPTVASVISAGNSGPGAGTIGEPGAGYNSITVGALAAAQFEDEVTGPSDFSSRGPVDFYNPVTETTVEDARTAIHIAAPGENLALAAYLGNTGGLTGLDDITMEVPATDLYFVYSSSGTSFSSPVVAGGVALLKDVAKGGVYLVGESASLDTRVVRSVIMASAVETPGWDNGQSLVDGVIVTEQGLDFATGAGGLDLGRAVEVYALNTTNVAGSSGGTVSPIGWDFGAVGLGLSNDYLFDSVFAPYTELTIALNWFVNQTFDALTNELVDTSASFADLDLEVWGLSEGVFTDLIATSASLYNSSEFLRILLAEGGQYGFRVTFDGIVYDATGLLSEEEYAIAWNTAVIPEPMTILFIFAVLAGVPLFRLSRRR